MSTENVNTTKVNKTIKQSLFPTEEVAAKLRKEFDEKFQNTIKAINAWAEKHKEHGIGVLFDLSIQTDEGSDRGCSMLFAHGLKNISTWTAQEVARDHTEFLPTLVRTLHLAQRYFSLGRELTKSSDDFAEFLKKMMGGESNEGKEPIKH